MDEEQIAKIESAVVTCLDACRKTERPFPSVNAYISKLKESPEWTDAELVELQTRVIRVLVYRFQHGAEP